MLFYYPDKRVAARAAMDHEYFRRAQLLKGLGEGGKACRVSLHWLRVDFRESRLRLHRPLAPSKVNLRSGAIKTPLVHVHAMAWPSQGGPGQGRLVQVGRGGSGSRLPG